MNKNNMMQYQNSYFNNNKKNYENFNNNNNDNINYNNSYYNNENEGFFNLNDNNNNNQFYYNNNNNINEREIYLDNENLPKFNSNKKINVIYKNSSKKYPTLKDSINANNTYNYNNNENDSYNNISSNYYSDKINNSVIINSNNKTNPFTFKRTYNNNNSIDESNNRNNNNNTNNTNNSNDLSASFNSNVSSPLLQIKDNKYLIKDKKKIIKKIPKKSAKIILKNGAHHRAQSDYLNKTIDNYYNFKNLLENINNESSENIFNYNNNNYNNNNNNNNKNEINFEDLVIINEKFNKIYGSIDDMNFNLINKVCYDYWNFFFNCSIKGNFSYFFLSDKNIINYFNSLFLVSILITYDLSFKEKYFNFFYQIIQNILQIAYENFLMIIQILLSNNFENNEKNVFIDELKYIINNSNINSENSPKINLLNKIKTNSEIIFNEITDIISHLNQTNYFENILNKKILDIFNNINYYSETEINSIFLSFILKINKNGSILFSTFNNNIPNNIQIISPIILNNIPKKPLTLILDLDQTIMSFISDNFNEFEGTTRTRPFLYNFLNLMVNYYEIIIFTASTRNYADPILDVIEKRKGNYFSYRLYREHCRIISNNYVKDISIINRNINRIIIVDNMSQNFKLQKENGILISSFWGYDEKDTALLELGEILELIALEMIESGYKIDIRDEIKKYKNDIYNKVSMN